MSGKDSSADATGDKGDKSILGNLLTGKTPAVKGIEAAYTRAGATNHHTPGYASKLGSQNQVGGCSHQGVGSASFADNLSDQRREVYCFQVHISVND
jgi:hypothetical protein